MVFNLVVLTDVSRNFVEFIPDHMASEPTG
jgi:hypothetical protein